MNLPVKAEELQALLSHESAFTRPFGLRVESVEDGVRTLLAERPALTALAPPKR